jgi:hypothetical protein
LGYAAISVVTLSVAISLVLLIARLPGHKETPAQLLRSAGALWICNFLVFACWYWRLDAGGPYERALRRSHTDGAFLFPQMVLDPDLRREMGEDQWRPGFVDYLFLAFNTSTAFSPTDVPVLSRWAKILAKTMWRRCRRRLTGNASKAQAIEALALAFERGDIRILNDAVLVSELAAYQAERLPSGLMRYGAPSGQHDDCVMALAIAWSAVSGQQRAIYPVPESCAHQQWNRVHHTAVSPRAVSERAC